MEQDVKRKLNLTELNDVENAYEDLFPGSVVTVSQEEITLVQGSTTQWRVMAKIKIPASDSAESVKSEVLSSTAIPYTVGNPHVSTPGASTSSNFPGREIN